MKYCLLAFSRTGSTAIEHSLSKHQSISHDFTRLPSVNDKQAWVRDFINRDSLSSKWSGFKCLLYHYDQYLERDILSNIKMRKIVLLRRDLFKAAISKKVAEKIGNWHRTVDYNNIEPFEIDERWFSGYIDFVAENVSKWKTKSENFKVFYYEDLFAAGGSYDSILSFLDIMENPKPYNTEKTNDYDKLYEYIKNIDKLKNIYESKKCSI